MKFLSKLAFCLGMMAPILLLGQRSEVYDELSSSFEYGKSAKEAATSALDHIKKAYEQTTMDDLHFQARKAKGDAEQSKSLADDAESDASDAEREADDIDCDDAEDDADDAEGNFESAESSADEAYSYLRRVEYSEDTDEIELNLKRAKASLLECIDHLNNGLIDLNDAIDELNECD